MDMICDQILSGNPGMDLFPELAGTLDDEDEEDFILEGFLDPAYHQITESFSYDFGNVIDCYDSLTPAEIAFLIEAEEISENDCNMLLEDVTDMINQDQEIFEHSDSQLNIGKFYLQERDWPNFTGANNFHQDEFNILTGPLFEDDELDNESCKLSRSQKVITESNQTLSVGNNLPDTGQTAEKINPTFLPKQTFSQNCDKLVNNETDIKSEKLIHKDKKNCKSQSTSNDCMVSEVESHPKQCLTFEEGKAKIQTQEISVQIKSIEQNTPQDRHSDEKQNEKLKSESSGIIYKTKEILAFREKISDNKCNLSKNDEIVKMNKISSPPQQSSTGNNKNLIENGNSLDSDRLVHSNSDISKSQLKNELPICPVSSEVSSHTQRKITVKEYYARKQKQKCDQVKPPDKPVPSVVYPSRNSTAGEATQLLSAFLKASTLNEKVNEVDPKIFVPQASAVDSHIVSKHSTSSKHQLNTQMKSESKKKNPHFIPSLSSEFPPENKLQNAQFRVSDASKTNLLNSKLSELPNKNTSSQQNLTHQTFASKQMQKICSQLKYLPDILHKKKKEIKTSSTSYSVKKKCIEDITKSCFEKNSLDSSQIHKLFEDLCSCLCSSPGMQRNDGNTSLGLVKKELEEKCSSSIQNNVMLDQDKISRKIFSDWQSISKSDPRNEEPKSDSTKGCTRKTKLDSSHIKISNSHFDNSAILFKQASDKSSQIELSERIFENSGDCTVKGEEEERTPVQYIAKKVIDKSCIPNVGKCKEICQVACNNLNTADNTSQSELSERLSHQPHTNSSEVTIKNGSSSVALKEFHSRCQKYARESSRSHSRQLSPSSKHRRRIRSRSPPRWYKRRASYSRSSRSPTHSYSSYSCYGSRSRSRSRSRPRFVRHRSRSRSSSSTCSRDYRRSKHSRDRSRSWKRTSRHSRTYSRSRSRSRSRNRNLKHKRYTSRSHRSRSPLNRKWETQRKSKKVQQIEERRVVYVGGIPNGMTHAQLRERFSSFGPIEEVSIHLRNHADNFGFVTFEHKRDAYNAVERGNISPLEPKFDLSFGGRRTFCRTRYSDLDSSYNIDMYVPPKDEEMDFDSLLKVAKAIQKKRQVS